MVQLAPVAQPDILYNNYPQRGEYVWDVQAIGGHNSYSALVRLKTGADVFIIDHANDGNAVNSFHRSALEALIRKLWDTNPNTRIMMVGSPSWNGLDTSNNALVHDPTNKNAIVETKALAEHYGLGYADYWQWCRDVVDAGTYTLAEIVPDKIHPFPAGLAKMSELLQPLLYSGAGMKPAVMPERVYEDSIDYENPPTVLLGNQYDNRTGTWVDDGTGVASTEAGATITYTVTCQSFGCLAAGNFTSFCQASVDGGAFEDAVLYQNGWVIESGRGLHTITIKVVDEVRIDEFWAI
jgi:hypothetical protein